METIIQQIAKKLINKILEKAYSGGISDIDALSSAVLGDCKEAAVEMIEEITVQLNRQIRNDKRRRKEEGLVLKEKERGRSLLTELGRLDISRDYYYDKKNDAYVYLLDHVIGLREYERVSDGVSAKLVSLASVFAVADGKIVRSRLVLGGVAPIPVRINEVEAFLVDKEITKSVSEEAAEIAVRHVLPMSKTGYKVQEIKAMIETAIMRLA